MSTQVIDRVLGRVFDSKNNLQKQQLYRKQQVSDYGPN